MKEPKTRTLYRAGTKIWGSNAYEMHYFETVQERNAWANGRDYTDKFHPVKLTESQYQQWKKYGEWDGQFFPEQ